MDINHHVLIETYMFDLCYRMYVKKPSESWYWHWLGPWLWYGFMRNWYFWKIDKKYINRYLYIFPKDPSIRIKLYMYIDNVFGPWNHHNEGPNRCQYHDSEGFFTYILYQRSNMYVYIGKWWFIAKIHFYKNAKCWWIIRTWIQYLHVKRWWVAKVSAPGDGNTVVLWGIGKMKNRYFYMFVYISIYL